MRVDESVQVEYRQIDRFPGYRFGSDGSVWSRYRSAGQGKGSVLSNVWRTLKQHPVRGGYLAVRLAVPGARRNPLCRVHHLILEAFIGPRPMGLEACHNDGDRTNNRPGNLRWDTQQANMADRALHGVSYKGEKNPNVKLSRGQVDEVREWRRQGMKLEEIACRVGLTPSAISKICLGHCWR